jgi:hypothetical protein
LWWGTGSLLCDHKGQHWWTEDAEQALVYFQSESGSPRTTKADGQVSF